MVSVDTIGKAATSADVETATVEDSAGLEALLASVYRHGFDFRDYRRGTMVRRLTRRLHAAGTRTYGEYARFLDTHPGELQKLADDVTIKTSGFFRNPYAWRQLGRLVLPALLEGPLCKPGPRFWSVACARGEEPYSLAIVLAECMGDRWRESGASVYATDISLRALGDAQVGVYSSKELEGVSPGRRESYFTPSGAGYRVNADIRQAVNFSYFDLTSTTDPPLIGLDCVFCCNVLIYFRKSLQERVLGMLYESLSTPGYLVLGEVETPTANLQGKLECLDSKARIYKKVR